MQYRILGRTEQQVSAISLGTEYLINLPREDVIATVHEAMDLGVNYYDLFFAQPEFRDTMGEAFRDYRAKVMLVAHLGAAEKDGQYSKTRVVKTAVHYFEDFLTRYHTDYADIVMVHNSDGQKDYDKIMRPTNLLGKARRFVEEGKARWVGFSGHTVSTALQAVESGMIDVLMFPINLASHAVEGKLNLLQACQAHNVGLVAMKPFAGGWLLGDKRMLEMNHWVSGGAEYKLNKDQPISPVQCLHYVLSQPGVSTIVPGCSNVQEIREAQAYWQATDGERDYSAIVAGFQQYHSGECTYCNHCLPCPSHIDIGQVNRLLDMAGDAPSDSIRQAYDAMEAHADDCVQCGACEERCPFDVSVMAKMEQAAALFG